MVQRAAAFEPGNRHQVGMPPVGVQIGRFTVAAIDRLDTQILTKGQLRVIQQGIKLLTAHQLLVLIGSDPLGQQW